MEVTCLENLCIAKSSLKEMNMCLQKKSQNLILRLKKTTL